MAQNSYPAMKGQSSIFQWKHNMPTSEPHFLFHNQASPSAVSDCTTSRVVPLWPTSLMLILSSLNHLFWSAPIYSRAKCHKKLQKMSAGKRGTGNAAWQRRGAVSNCLQKVEGEVCQQCHSQWQSIVTSLLHQKLRLFIMRYKERRFSCSSSVWIAQYYALVPSSPFPIYSQGAEHIIPVTEEQTSQYQPKGLQNVSFIETC